MKTCRQPAYRLIAVGKTCVLESEIRPTEQALPESTVFVSSLKRSIEDIADES